MVLSLDDVVARLAAAGFIAADEEAAELVAAAGGDDKRLSAMLARRLEGEPLAWITGTAELCGVRVRVDPGVYVPRWATELVAERAVALLPDAGIAVDLCTGSGAVAVVLRTRRPDARVVAGDIEERAVATARRNGVDAHVGDLFDAIPAELRGFVDVVIAVAPYVPSDELGTLQRDTFTYETALAYDGGDDGLDVVRRVLRDARRWLRPGGSVVLELGADQPAQLSAELARLEYDDVEVLRDADGDVRGLSARWGARARR